MEEIKKKTGKIILDNLTKEKKITWHYDEEKQLFITEQALANPRASVEAYNKYIVPHVERESEKAHVEGERMAVKNIPSSISKVKSYAIKHFMKSLFVKRQEAGKDGDLTPIEIVNANFCRNLDEMKFEEYGKNKFITKRPVLHPKSAMKVVNQDSKDYLRFAKASQTKDRRVIITLTETDMNYLKNTTKAQKLTLSSGFVDFEERQKRI